MTDEERSRFVATITGHLAASSIPYMVTGSFASSFYGAPRATQDLDTVIAPATPAALTSFTVRATDAGFYASEPAAQDAFQRRRQFNVIDPASGWKADLILIKDRPFSQEEFRRRRKAVLLGVEVQLATPEDVIVAKLEWARRASSQRQIEDVAGILRVQAGALDHPYLEHWIRSLGLTAEWTAARGAGTA